MFDELQLDLKATSLKMGEKQNKMLGHGDGKMKDQQASPAQTKPYNNMPKVVYGETVGGTVQYSTPP